MADAAPSLIVHQIGDCDGVTGAVTYQATVDEVGRRPLALSFTLPRDGDVADLGNGMFRYTPDAVSMFQKAAKKIGTDNAIRCIVKAATTTSRIGWPTSSGTHSGPQLRVHSRRRAVPHRSNTTKLSSALLHPPCR